MSKAWFVIVTKPQQEARAAVELGKQDFQVFMPILDGKPKYGRYIFAFFDRNVDDWGKIRSTRGCCDVVKIGFQPCPVPAHVMEAIRNAPPPAPEPTPAEINYAQGQRVRIIEGPGAGLEGLFDKDIKKRTAALLKIMGKTVELPRAAIRAA